MEDATRLGHNRTGMQMSPLQSEVQRDTAMQLSQDTAVADPDQPEALLMAEMRREYITEADSLGTVPPPGTMSGMLKTGAAALTGKRVQVLVDKIAERLAFERGGTRLYDAALVKVATLAEGTPVRLERVKQIRNQEAEHAELLRQALERLGADPTAQTPSADLVGVQAMGLMQAVTDPRTTLPQTLSSLLAAELIDVASWEMLARLANQVGQDELVAQFETAHRHEEEHLATVSGWLEALLSEDAKLLS